jgi:O-acetyl-ADP-ribose deacetylase (regulator of RNase III)
MDITYLKGDVTEVCVDEGIRIIAHICNDIGKMGSGVAKALMKKWPTVRERYLAWHISGKEFKGGQIQVVKVERFLYVVNMIGQNGVRGKGNLVPANLKDIDRCLFQLSNFINCFRAIDDFIKFPFCVENNITLHLPRIACGLAGQTWNNIEPIVIKHLNHSPVYIYDLPEKR